MKLIIYAIGEIFYRYENEINWNCVVALADKGKHDLETIHERSVISPKEISQFQYDYIVVFSNRYYEEIRMELSGEYFISLDKILPYRSMIKSERNDTIEIMEYYRLLCVDKKCRKLLECGLSDLSLNYNIITEIFHDDAVFLDRISEDAADDNVNLYRKVYHDIQECCDGYDAVIMTSILGMDQVESEIAKCYLKGRIIMFMTDYLTEGDSIKTALYPKLKKYGEVNCISTVVGLLWVIDTKATEFVRQASVYVAVHREYNCQCDGMYKPLCLGGYVHAGYLTEQTGMNISYLNDKINECSALYWIWKNTDEKYVGLNHYRRYFYNNELRSIDNFLNEKNLSEILKEYDIILPQVQNKGSLTLYHQLENTMNQELFVQGYTIIREKIKEKQPGYLHSFDRVMAGHCLFPCNMFVTSRDILNRYCEWLFSFLIEAAEEINTERYDIYSRRVMGFFAERMWTVWLKKNKLKIKELPIVTGWEAVK